MYKLFNKIHCFRFNRKLAQAYLILAVLQKLFFERYLKQENALRQYKILNKQHRKFYLCLKKIRHLITKVPSEKIRYDQIEKLHEIVCAIHLLRFRVNDLSLFEICSQEMHFLQKTSTALLKQCCLQAGLGKKLKDFHYSIEAFENINTNTLQIVARDPMVFQFFIQDFYALYQWGCDYERIFQKQQK